jgi:competence protein ComEA
LAERTDATVTPASTSVPPAEARAEIVTQSATARVYGAATKLTHHGDNSVVTIDDVDVRIPALSRRQLFVVAAAVVVLLLLLFRHLGGGGSSAPTVTPVQVTARPKAAAPKLLVIDVAGAVRRPGLYRLREGSRIDDAIASAGGPTAKAQLDMVNLAAPVADGEQVVVPGRGPGDVAAPSGPAAGSSPSAPLDLNSATLEELENLPGIGPAHMAQLKGLVIP